MAKKKPASKPAEPFGGKGDHDGNGTTGGSAPALPALGTVVTVHTRNPINGLTEQDGVVVKVMGAGRYVVSIPLYAGGNAEFLVTADPAEYQHYTMKPEPESEDGDEP